MSPRHKFPHDCYLHCWHHSPTVQGSPVSGEFSVTWAISITSVHLCCENLPSRLDKKSGEGEGEGEDNKEEEKKKTGGMG